MTPFFAITTRGLEDVSLRELSALASVMNLQTSYRRVTAQVDGDLSALLSLQTVDDVFLYVTRWESLTHTREALLILRSLSADLDLRPIIRTLNTVRSVSTKPSFSVTANFVGKRNYNAEEIKSAVSEGVLSRYKHWRYSEDDDMAEVNLRVFIDHDEAVIGARLGETPLYRRPYKQSHLPGSLKPTVAAAMLMLASAQRGETLLDAFCGSGTILVEGGLSGLRVYGGDRKAEATAYARQNSRDAGVKALISQWDATRLPLLPNRVDLAVSNLPWGRQIQIDSALETLYSRAVEALQRVVKPNGRLLLLTSLPELLPQESILEKREISLFGQNPTIVTLG
jgi:tRNA (guanine6-N2)-methyltransferase